MKAPLPEYHAAPGIVLRNDQVYVVRVRTRHRFLRPPLTTGVTVAAQPRAGFRNAADALRWVLCQEVPDPENICVVLGGAIRPRPRKFRRPASRVS